MPSARSQGSSRLEVLYQDDLLVAINKPPGVSSVHDSARADEPTAIDMLAREFGDIFTVHRIDHDTSGVLIAARTVEAHRHLSAQFEGHSVEKSYRCIVRGHPIWNARVVDAPLRANAGRAHRTVLDDAKGKPARTRFSVVERFSQFALVTAEPEHGRRHQIRAQLEHIGSPIVCDELYGDGRPLLLSEVKRGYRPSSREERPLLGRLGLHATELTFDHPATGERITVTAPLPADFEVTLKQLRRWAPL